MDPNSAIRSIRKRVLAGDLLAGTFLNLGSQITAEMAGLAGFDWLLVDAEHGLADIHNLLSILQAIDATPAVGVVRVVWNDPAVIKKVLDLGPSGVMIPYVNTPEEARRAVAATRYPPAGVRGVARLNRACRFGDNFDRYFAQISDELLTIVQIETTESLANAEAIAAVDGVDALFVGPLDLSVSLGIPQQFGHETFRNALARIGAAARDAGKAAGTLVMRPDQLSGAVELGYTLIAVGSDGGAVAGGLKKLAESFETHKGVQKA